MDNVAFDSPAIPPPISVETFGTNPAVYKVQDNVETAYDVEDGNEFSVICTSSGTFSGRVTWTNNGRNWYDGFSSPVVW